MRIKIFTALFIFSFGAAHLCAQQLEILTDGGKSSLRGVTVYKNTVWVSGSAGTVGRSDDGGKSWQWGQVKGFEKTEFRDIEAIDENTAIIMGIASPANILTTTNGGKSWDLVYTNQHPSMFLDAMGFDKNRRGVVIGDPVNGRIFVAKANGAGHWQETSALGLPKAISGEAFFAASGTNIVLKQRKFYLVSGGRVSRLFMKNRSMLLPLMQGKETTGANSIAVFGRRIVVAGGDFMKPDRTDSVLAVSNNNGKTWKLPAQPPTGYRSCVCFVNKKTLIACGINGIDISTNGGRNWENISKQGFNGCVFNKENKTVYFAGNKSGVGKISF